LCTILSHYFSYYCSTMYLNAFAKAAMDTDTVCLSDSMPVVHAGQIQATV